MKNKNKRLSHSQGDARGKRPQRNTLRTLKEYPIKVIVELKSVEAIKNIHIAQMLTYLKAKNLKSWTVDQF